MPSRRTALTEARRACEGLDEHASAEYAAACDAAGQKFSIYSYGEYVLRPWIGLKTADNHFVPWTAPQTDILAEDWTEAP